MFLTLAALIASVAPAAAASAEATTAAAPAHQSRDIADYSTDSPRETLRLFMEAMDCAVQARRADDRDSADFWLAEAVRCLDLSQVNIIGRDIIGREAAQYLKEIIDRAWAVDYGQVPSDSSIRRWRIPNTQIVIQRMEGGERGGEYLFSAQSVERARELFQLVRHQPLLPGALGGGLQDSWQESWLPDALKQELFGITYWQWILLTALVFVGLVVRQVIKFLAFLAKAATSRTSVSWDDDLVRALTGPIIHLGTTGIWFVSLHFLGITGTAYTVIAFLIKGAFFINLAYLAYNLAGFVGELIEKNARAKAAGQDINQGLFKLLRQTFKVVALVLILLVGVQNMGMDVASLIAGLGIGGLAFALAARDTLANFFGSVMIMLDRPFKVGDWIIAKGVEGVVEEIGFRSTRIRTFYNSLVSIPNSELVMDNIDNMGLREWRRVRETYSLIYATPPELVDAFCAGVRRILQSRPEVKQDAIVVYFNALAASSLDILVNYHIKAATWAEELAIRHEVLREVLRMAHEIGASFAFPTQTLHIESLPPLPRAPTGAA